MKVSLASINCQKAETVSNLVVHTRVIDEAHEAESDLAVCTQAGATFDEDFPGWAALFRPDGKIVDELPDWKPGTLIVEI
jgi:predicted amidohydrolase